MRTVTRPAGKRHAADRIDVDVVALRNDEYDDQAARREGARFFSQFSGVSSATVQFVAQGRRVSRADSRKD